jgi:cell division protein FtsQ
MLIDAGGVLMDLTNKKKFSFPVIIGMSASEPLSTRSIRMKTFNQLVRELDSSGGRYSQDLSEVDLTDPEDVKVLTNDPAGEVLVHLGSANFLDRFKIYVGHLREWRQQFTKLESVDLRYDQQIIVNPDLRGTAKQPVLTPAAAKAAMAAGVKPSALISRQPTEALTPHLVTVKPLKKSASVQTSPASPKWKKRQTPAAKVKAASIRQKQPVAHKHWTPAKHSAWKPRAGGDTVQAKSPSAPQKPSPAIAKGQDTH